MKKIYKLASQMAGIYKALYRDTMPFHNENTDKYQARAFKIIESIEEEVDKEIANDGK